MDSRSSINRCSEAVVNIDTFLKKNQIPGTYDEWLSRYSADPTRHEDSFIFGKLVQSMLSGGMKGIVVDKWMPKISRSFRNWDVDYVAEMTIQDINILIKKELIFNNPPKMSAIVGNAKIFKRLISKHGTYGHYLKSFSNLQTLKSDLQQFDYIGPVTAEDFLRNIGFDTAKPDRHLTRWLTRMGAIERDPDVNQTILLIDTISNQADIPRATFDAAIYLFCADRKDVLDSGGICGKNPKCIQCPITKLCPAYGSMDSFEPPKKVIPLTRIKQKEILKNPSLDNDLDPLSVWNTKYRGMSKAEVEIINPFAEEGWLKEPFGNKGSRTRIGNIIKLFDNQSEIASERISKLGRNYGKYAAYRAIVHEYAIWDLEVLKRTKKSFQSL